VGLISSPRSYLTKQIPSECDSLRNANGGRTIVEIIFWLKNDQRSLGQYETSTSAVQ